MDKHQVMYAIAEFLQQQGIACIPFSDGRGEAFIEIGTRTFEGKTLFVAVDAVDGVRFSLGYLFSIRYYDLADPACFDRLAADIWQLVKNKKSDLTHDVRRCLRTNKYRGYLEILPRRRRSVTATATAGSTTPSKTAGSPKG